MAWIWVELASVAQQTQTDTEESGVQLEQSLHILPGVGQRCHEWLYGMGHDKVSCGGIPSCDLVNAIFLS